VIWPDAHDGPLRSGANVSEIAATALRTCRLLLLDQMTLIAKHGIGLSRSSLAIGKNSAIESLNQI
jgi:hypothetical protein